MNSSIQIKDCDILANLLSVKYHPKLPEVLTWIHEKYKEIVITCGYRHNDTGVHGQIPCRGIDLRSTTFADPKAVETDINNHWEYDPSRPDMKVALLHDIGRGIHFHIQVHDKTILK